MKKILSTLIIFCFLVPLFVFAQSENQINAPENVEEVKTIGEKALTIGEKELPGIIQKIWKEEVVPLWLKMYGWFKSRYGERINNWFQKTIKPELEKRKPKVEEEFKKESGEMKTEVKQELPKIGQSLWQKFKELIK
ncbi:MAG: hypothetical protein Q8N87_00410 [bacterium]|nr:hypothetical protein [bacterium]